MKPGLLVINFGGPQGPDELEPFLAELFRDVLPVPGFLQPLAIPRIASARANKVRDAYASIGWSPLVPTTLEQVADLVEALGADAPPTAAGMQFTRPTLDEALDKLLAEDVDAIVAVALFPHFSLATTGSSYDMLHAVLQRRGVQLPVHWVPAWFDHPAYIEALADTIRVDADATPGEGPIHLLFSPHGLPVSFIKKGDPYPDQVRESARRAIAAAGWSDPWYVGWQSRVGPTRWLEPSTEDVIRELGAKGAQRVCVVPLAFVGEHIETLYEIDVEYAELAHEVGIAHFGRAPALGRHPAFIRCLADVVRSALADLDGYKCVRCLIPKERSHGRRPTCASCGFKFPAYLRDGA